MVLNLDFCTIRRVIDLLTVFSIMFVYITPETKIKGSYKH